MIQSTALGFFASHWGDLASVVGFVITILTLLRTKRAVEAAKDATLDLQKRLTRVNVVGDLAAVLEMIEEIKRLHRAEAWDILLDRYSVVRRHLVSIQGSGVNINGDQGVVIARAIQQFRTMEQKVERVRKTEPKDLDLVRLNTASAKILDELNRVMISIRQVAD